MDSPFLRRLATLLWTDEPRTRIRLQHWSLTIAIYVASASVMFIFTSWHVLNGGAIVLWTSMILCALGVVHLLIRSQWSNGRPDPAMSQAQIVIGIFGVMGAYYLAGEARSATMLPLMLILTFGAFSAPLRRMIEITVLALCALGCTMLTMHALHPGVYSTVIDLSNFLIGTIVLPAVSCVAMILSSLRERLSRQRAELQAALARIQDLATRDDLTGLANRRHAQQLLDFETQRNQRAGQPFSVALIDLDHFKLINDRHGHAAGDTVLRRFADEARAELRGFDLVARWGGEEFLLLMPNTGAPWACATMERLRVRVDGLRLPGEAGTAGDIRVQCSAGVAEHIAGQTVAQTISRADEALYRAKAAGRNRVEQATPSATGHTEAQAASRAAHGELDSAA